MRNKPPYHQTGDSIKEYDLLYNAKKPGKRLSKQRKKIYYEYRKNRSDKGKWL